LNTDRYTGEKLWPWESSGFHCLWAKLAEKYKETFNNESLNHFALVTLCYVFSL